MKCEEFLLTMETGDSAHVLEAQRHAANCPSCALAYDGWLEIKQVLAAHQPLSDAARAVWECASKAAIPVSRERPKWTRAVAASIATCAACAVVLFLAVSGRIAEKSRPIADSHASLTTVVEHDPAAELAQLAAAVDELDDKLVALTEYAERLDIEREITLTLNEYDRW
jgi:hypothetical protein